jgi:hypothetical protein
MCALKQQVLPPRATLGGVRGEELSVHASRLIQERQTGLPLAPHIQGWLPQETVIIVNLTATPHTVIPVDSDSFLSDLADRTSATDGAHTREVFMRNRREGHLTAIVCARDADGDEARLTKTLPFNAAASPLGSWAETARAYGTSPPIASLLRELRAAGRTDEQILDCIAKTGRPV